MESGDFATDLVAQRFRQDRRLGSKERNAVSTLFYDMLRQVRRLEYAFALGVKGGVRGDVTGDELYLTWMVLNDELGLSEAAYDMPEVQWERVARAPDSIAAIKDPVERLGVAQSVPDWMARRFLEEHGDQAEPMLTALNQRGPLTLRVNPLKATREQVAERLKEEGWETTPCELAPLGLNLERHINVFSLDAFKEGWFEVQDEASQLVAELVAPPPGGTVADVCAGAGGKTLALAGWLKNKGFIVAADTHSGRLGELVKRSRRAGISNMQAVLMSREDYPAPLSKRTGQFARVLTDVPCSGLGALRRNPEARWRWTEEELDRFPIQQLDIARKALTLLQPGGRLIYATCTVLKAENQQVVETLLAENPSLEVVSPAEIWGRERAEGLLDPSGRFLQMLPHQHGTDGFFAAVLRLPRNRTGAEAGK